MKIPSFIRRFVEILRPPIDPSYPFPRRGPGCPQGVVKAGDLHSSNIEVIDRRTGKVFGLVKMVDVDAGVMVRYRELKPVTAREAARIALRPAGIPPIHRPKIMLDGLAEPVTETLKGPWGIRMRKPPMRCKGACKNR